MLQEDGLDFPLYQKNFVEHYDQINVPAHFNLKDVEASHEILKSVFSKSYPGEAMGASIDPTELSPTVRQAWATYNHERYLSLFEQTAESFGLDYAYYLVPTGEEYHMYWMLDAMRDVRDDGFLQLGIDEEESPERHPHMWEAWNTGRTPDGYDTFDNEYGKTYAWYYPLYIAGEKLGLIGTEVEISNYHHAVAQSTWRQLGMIAVILLVTSAFTLWLIDRLYISKIRRLAHVVDEYAQDKDAAVISKIEQTAEDELSTLANQTAVMILELDNYMKSLLKTTEELLHTQERVGVESELARKDALTGARNRNAYEEAEKRLTWQLGEGNTRFGIAVVDVNFLKRVNDTYGHERGNITITRCYELVSEVFAGSPVYRIGGDEFAVVLEGEDLDNIEQLAHKFDEAIAATEGEPWEKVSAALGYATFDPARDDCVQNVFNRADKAMYKRKRAMKGRRR